MLTHAILLASLTASTAGATSAPALAVHATSAAPRPVRLAQAAGQWRSQPPPAAALPPPPPPERVRPRRGWVWVEGGYEWRGRQYVRLPGHWERERPGRQWHSGRWEWRGDRYAWIPGTWMDGPAYSAPPALVVQSPTPPPPPPAPVAPTPPPRQGFVWIPGAHEWRGDRYEWVEGHWEPEHAGDSWHPGHWDCDGERHAWHPGGWEHGDHHDHGEHGEHGEHRGHGEHGFRPNGALSISGRVVDQMGRPAAGIVVVLAGSSEGRVVTDGNGQYVFAGLAPGSYSVRPNDPRCGFGPDVANLNNLGGSVVQNFNANCR